MAFKWGLVGMRIDSGHLNITRRTLVPVIVVSREADACSITCSFNSLADIGNSSECTRSAFEQPFGGGQGKEEKDTDIDMRMQGKAEIGELYGPLRTFLAYMATHPPSSAAELVSACDPVVQVPGGVWPTRRAPARNPSSWWERTSGERPFAGSEHVFRDPAWAWAWTLEVCEESLAIGARHE
ncbi:hypothetical protein BJV74DRAFT_799230 [Russula compacta]|nr:hypothetical protein BJV74DRAFT_799230 [Russula compacta]